MIRRWDGGRDTNIRVWVYVILNRPTILFVGTNTRYAVQNIKGYKKPHLVTYISQFYLQSLLPYYDSMHTSVKELLARAVKKKSSENVLNKK